MKEWWKNFKEDLAFNITMLFMMLVLLLVLYDNLKELITQIF